MIDRLKLTPEYKVTQNRKSDRVAVGKVVNKACKIEAPGGILFIYLARLASVN